MGLCPNLLTRARVELAKSVAMAIGNTYFYTPKGMMSKG